MLQDPAEEPLGPDTPAGRVEGLELAHLNVPGVAGGVDVVLLQSGQGLVGRGVPVPAADDLAQAQQQVAAEGLFGRGVGVGLVKGHAEVVHLDDPAGAAEAGDEGLLPLALERAAALGAAGDGVLPHGALALLHLGQAQGLVQRDGGELVSVAGKQLQQVRHVLRRAGLGLDGVAVPAEQLLGHGDNVAVGHVHAGAEAAAQLALDVAELVEVGAVVVLAAAAGADVVGALGLVVVPEGVLEEELLRVGEVRVLAVQLDGHGHRVGPQTHGRADAARGQRHKQVAVVEVGLAEEVDGGVEEGALDVE